MFLKISMYIFYILISYSYLEMKISQRMKFQEKFNPIILAKTVLPFPINFNFSIVKFNISLCNSDSSFQYANNVTIYTFYFNFNLFHRNSHATCSNKLKQISLNTVRRIKLNPNLFVFSASILVPLKYCLEISKVIKI